MCWVRLTVHADPADPVHAAPDPGPVHAPCGPAAAGPRPCEAPPAGGSSTRGGTERITLNSLYASAVESGGPSGRPTLNSFNGVATEVGGPELVTALEAELQEITDLFISVVSV